MTLKNIYILIFLSICLCSLFACKKSSTQPDMELAQKVLIEYSNSESIGLDNFKDGIVYSDPNHDACVEYITKDYYKPKHILLLYFKEGKIVERHRNIEIEQPAQPERE